MTPEHAQERVYECPSVVVGVIMRITKINKTICKLSSIVAYLHGGVRFVATLNFSDDRG